MWFGAGPANNICFYTKTFVVGRVRLKMRRTTKKKCVYLCGGEIDKKQDLRVGQREEI